MKEILEYGALGVMLICLVIVLLTRLKGGSEGYGWLHDIFSE